MLLSLSHADLSLTRAGSDTTIDIGYCNIDYIQVVLLLELIDVNA
jgi:hypothetical protein